MSRFARFALGIGGLWLILTAMDDAGQGELAGALAITVAMGAAYYLLIPSITAAGALDFSAHATGTQSAVAQTSTAGFANLAQTLAGSGTGLAGAPTPTGASRRVNAT